MCLPSSNFVIEVNMRRFHVTTGSNLPWKWVKATAIDYELWSVNKLFILDYIAIVHINEKRKCERSNTNWAEGIM